MIVLPGNDVKLSSVCQLLSVRQLSSVSQQSTWPYRQSCSRRAICDLIRCNAGLTCPSGR